MACSAGERTCVLPWREQVIADFCRVSRTLKLELTASWPVFAKEKTYDTMIDRCATGVLCQSWERFSSWTASYVQADVCGKFRFRIKISKYRTDNLLSWMRPCKYSLNRWKWCYIKTFLSCIVFKTTLFSIKQISLVSEQCELVN